jgi:hypothetical protein
MSWQTHIYGTPRPEVVAWCNHHDVALHAFGWRKEYETAGLVRDGLYLLRPDTYVALADASGAADVLEGYFAERQIRPANPPLA